VDTAVADTPSTRRLLRRSLQAGMLFFVAKGCAWLLAAALLGGLL
jgi:hypothetical protein